MTENHIRIVHRLPAYMARIRFAYWCAKEKALGRLGSAGKKGAIGRGVRILGTIRIELGEGVALRDGVIIGGHGTLSIGSRTAINADCIITAMERVTIGADVMLAPRVYVLDVDHNFDRTDIPINQQGYKINPVVIEDDVWIGAGCVITRGVRIGRGSVIGANSVVNRDIPPYSVAAGCPARVIRERRA